MRNQQKFLKDMENAGYQTYTYRGRNYYEGPAVNTDRHNGPSVQDIIRATTVKVVTDNMGLDYVVYPG